MARISEEISPQGASENLGTQQRTELRSAAGKFKQTRKDIAAKRLPSRRRHGAHPRTKCGTPAPSVGAAPALNRHTPPRGPVPCQSPTTIPGRSHGKESRP